MGIIQSAVNQALGTIGTVAGIGQSFKLKQEAAEAAAKKEEAARLQQANLKAQAEKDLKEEQVRLSQEFGKKFMEGVNTMKGVRSVTTFGADTGSPYLRNRTVYTPGREEFK